MKMKMTMFKKAKDGGPKSHVTGYFLIEMKSLFSVVLLHFADGTRETFHSHAFDALTLWLLGSVREEYPSGRFKIWSAGEFKATPKNLTHRIRSLGSAWALSIRGPWRETWAEFDPVTENLTTLTHGRRVVN